MRMDSGLYALCEGKTSHTKALQYDGNSKFDDLLSEGNLEAEFDMRQTLICCSVLLFFVKIKGLKSQLGDTDFLDVSYVGLDGYPLKQPSA